MDCNWENMVLSLDFVKILNYSEGKGIGGGV